MTPSFNQAFAAIRSAIPNDVEAVILYRRKQYFSPVGASPAVIKEYETGFAFHTDTKTAQHFFDRVERLARQRLRDEIAAVIFTRWPDMRNAWAVADAFELEES